MNGTTSGVPAPSVLRMNQRPLPLASGGHHRVDPLAIPILVANHRLPARRNENEGEVGRPRARAVADMPRVSLGNPRPTLPDDEDQTSGLKSLRGGRRPAV